MTDLSELQAAREQLTTARATLQTKGKQTLLAVVDEIFNAHPDIHDISWASKSSEYDDQGMYPGIAGPVANEDENYNDGYPEWLYDYRFQQDPRLAPLKQTLDLLGEDVLSELFGDEEQVTVRRELPSRFETNYVGY